MSGHTRSTCNNSEMNGDEEIARALQALDNGLRERKRSISVSEEPKKVSRSRVKSETPSRRAKPALEAPSSPHSGSSHSADSPGLSDHQDSALEVPRNSEDLLDEAEINCLACGKHFSAEGDASASKENHLICGACFVRYSLQPYKAHAVVRASPSHRCEGHGCAVTFLTADRLRDHYSRVHGNVTKIA